MFPKRKYVLTFGESTFGLKQARKKFNLVPSNKIKIHVVFLGEPAVDDGSPRKEFFSGKLIRTNGHNTCRCLITIQY